MALTNAQKRKILSQKVEQTIKSINSLDKSTVQDVLRNLRKAQGDISNILKGTTRFTPSFLNTLRNEINDRIVDFEKQMVKSTLSSEGKAWIEGEELTNRVFKSTQFGRVVPKLSTALLVAEKDLSADLITGMADDMKKDISRSLRRSMLAGENNFESARKIDKIIGVNKKSGYMNRSDVIVRQETGRVYSVARHAKDLQTDKIVGDMIKEWATAGDELVRPSPTYPHQFRFKWNHREANGQIRKVDEPFDVSGEKLMYPRDILGSAGNVVRCRCTHFSYPREWGT